MLKHLAPAALLLAAALLLPGCLGISAQKTYNYPPTTGQQLSDLKVALETDAISQAEYDELRAGILSTARNE